MLKCPRTGNSEMVVTSASLEAVRRGSRVSMMEYAAITKNAVTNRREQEKKYTDVLTQSQKADDKLHLRKAKPSQVLITSEWQN